MFAFVTGSRLISVRMSGEDHVVMMKTFGLFLLPFLGVLLFFLDQLLEKVNAELIDHLLGLYKKIEEVYRR
jgi:hypothetical protein